MWSSEALLSAMIVGKLMRDPFGLRDLIDSGSFMHLKRGAAKAALVRVLRGLQSIFAFSSPVEGFCKTESTYDP